MRRLAGPSWLPLVFGLVSMLIALTLAASPQVQAVERLLQTVPTPTPHRVPTPVGPPESSGPAESTLPSEASTSQHGLTLFQVVRPHDVLPGQKLEFSLWLTNTSNAALIDIVIVDALDPNLIPLEIQATQGAVRIEDSIAFIHLGTLEAGSGALLILHAQVDTQAQPGTIILNQFVAHFDDSEASSNIAAAGLPPAALPATGREGRGP